MKAEMVVGMVTKIDGKKITIEMGEGYEPFVAVYEGSEVEKQTWVLETLGKRVRCKVVDDVIKEIGVLG